MQKIYSQQIYYLLSHKQLIILQRWFILLSLLTVPFIALDIVNAKTIKVNEVKTSIRGNELKTHVIYSLIIKKKIIIIIILIAFITHYHIKRYDQMHITLE